MLFNGLEVIAYNVNRHARLYKLFETARLNGIRRTPKRNSTKNIPVCLFLTGTADKSWNVQPGKKHFFRLKRLRGTAPEAVRADPARWKRDLPPPACSGRALYSLPGQHLPLAVVGSVAPALAKKFDVRQPVFAAEINWFTLFELIKRNKVTFKEMPRFPEVRRDLALLLDESIRYADLQKSAFRVAKKLLKQVSLFDVYRGDKIPADKKQYALNFVLQDLEKTLTDEDVERVMGKLISTFRNEYGATLRD